jgi:hypothetical protein
VAGVGSPAHAAAVPWGKLGAELARLPGWQVLADCGRYTPGNGIVELLRRSHLVTSKPSSGRPASPTPSPTTTPTCADASNACAPKPGQPPTPAAAPAAAENTVVLALTSQITRLKKQHRKEVQALRDALEQAHGENLDLRRELARRGETSPPRSGIIGPS